MIPPTSLTRALTATIAIAAFSTCNARAADNEVEMPEGATSEEIVEVMKTRGIVRVPPSGSMSSGGQPSNEPAEPMTYLTVRVYFEYDSDRLTPEARDELDRLGGALSSSELRGNRWLVEGHTDATGSSEYNQSLSERRANSVYRYLVSEHAIEQTQLVPLGKGEAELYDPNNPNAGVNRRVRIGHLGG